MLCLFLNPDTVDDRKCELRDGSVGSRVCATVFDCNLVMMFLFFCD